MEDVGIGGLASLPDMCLRGISGYGTLAPLLVECRMNNKPFYAHKASKDSAINPP